MSRPPAFDPKARRGQRAAVLGLGRSGLAVARLLARKGFRVLASDSRPRGELAAAARKLPSSVRWEAGGHSRRLLGSDFAVKSPGLKPGLPILKSLSEAGVPVYSELEVSLAFGRPGAFVAVTGTNGKSTTVCLARDIFAAAAPRGGRALLAGNIGIPMAEIAPNARPKDVLVAECSSYQLEDSASVRPQAAAILNLTADHLDHHGSMAAYASAKARIFSEQGPEDACVFNADDPLVLKLSRGCPSRRLFFGSRSGLTHAWEEGGRLVFRLPGWRREVRLKPPRLAGRHNLENAMAAALLAFSRGAKPSAVRRAFAAFRGIEHRLEEAGAPGGLRCVNDSKATNVDSTLVALRALSGPRRNILLVLGGLHKGSPYAPLRPLIERGVKGILTIGSAARRIEEDLAGSAPVFPCGDLATAVDTAFRVGSRGDLLLLSPACASFDQFRDFEDRGRAFKSLVAARRRGPRR